MHVPTSNVGFDILIHRPYTNHPKDHYLKAVLGHSAGRWVTWVYNVQSGGFFWGHYFDNETAAAHDYKERGR